MKTLEQHAADLLLSNAESMADGPIEIDGLDEDGCDLVRDELRALLADPPRLLAALTENLEIERARPYASRITYCGQSAVLVCDRLCEKAWGRHSRPKIHLSGDPDDIEWLSDSEVGSAPPDPGSYEGRGRKPTDRRHNRWCARECERSRLSMPDEKDAEAPDWSRRIRNITP